MEEKGKAEQAGSQHAKKETEIQGAIKKDHRGKTRK